MQPTQRHDAGDKPHDLAFFSSAETEGLLASPITNSRPEQIQDGLTRLIGTHRLDFVTPASATDNACQLKYTSTGKLSLIDLKWQGALQIKQKQPDSLYAIYIPLVGSFTIQINPHQTVNCLPNTTATLVNPGQDPTAKTSQKGEVLLIGIERTIVEQALANLLGRSVKQPVVFEPAINLTYDLGNHLKQFAQFLWQGLTGETVRSPLVIKELEQAFLNCLLEGIPHNYSGALLYQHVGVLACYVQKAQAFIEANLQADIRLGDVAAAVEVCPRMLEKAFAYHCDYSPMQFLKQARLRHIREELCHAPPGTKVVEVMMRHGFTEGGKFAKAYREMFGELPSETLKRHRQV